MDPLTFRFLGTSGHGITPTRNLPSILLDGCILIDCGEGTLKALKSVGISPAALQAIFLTHLHADHFLGLISLLWDLALYLRDDLSVPAQSPPIYLPQGMAAQIETIIEASFSPFGKVHFVPQFVELACPAPKLLQKKFGGKLYSVEWIQLKHDPVCYGYKFNKMAVFCGDSAPDPALAPFIQGAQLLVHEATFPDAEAETAHRLNHSTPIDVAKLGCAGGVAKIYLTHLPPAADRDEDSFLKGAKEVFPNIRVARDLLSDRLGSGGGKLPS